MRRTSKIDIIKYTYLMSLYSEETIVFPLLFLFMSKYSAKVRVPFKFNV